MARVTIDGITLDSSCRRPPKAAYPALDSAVARIGRLHERLLSARRSPLGDEGLTSTFSGRIAYAEAQWAEGLRALGNVLEQGRAAKSEYSKLMACVESIAASGDDEQGERLREYEMKQMRYLGRRILDAEAKHYGRQGVEL